MSMELSVQGKNAIVTGAAGNIGEACVRALAAAGANVLVADMDARRGGADGREAAEGVP